MQQRVPGSLKYLLDLISSSFRLILAVTAKRLTKYSLQNRGCREALRKYCRKYPNNDFGNLRWILQTLGRLTQTL